MKTAAVLLTLSFGFVVHAAADTQPNNPCFLVNTKKIPAECSHYIEGFLDGALETDSAIIKKVDAGDAKHSEFLARAYRTRLGKSLKDLPSTFLADFCLPPLLTRADLVSRIAQQLSGEEQVQPSFSAAVYATVKQQFPCE